MLARLARKPVTWIIVAVLLIGGGFGLYWFQPWKLFTSKTVNETLPAVEPAPSTASPSTAGPTAPPRNTLLASGTLITHEHETSGTVQLVRLADGRVQLAFADLSTSDGPDLRVWLTDQPVLEGRAGWHVFDDGRYVELGRLKANRGNQVYDVPAGADLTGLTSVTIWCKRFSVSFGAAALAPRLNPPAPSCSDASPASPRGARSGARRAGRSAVKIRATAWQSVPQEPTEATTAGQLRTIKHADASGDSEQGRGGSVGRCLRGLRAGGAGGPSPRLIFLVGQFR